MPNSEVKRRSADGSVGSPHARVGNCRASNLHRQQALVLINEHDAKSEDVVQLAHHVRQKVGEKFNVWLEPEVRFIGASGEVSAVETIS